MSCPCCGCHRPLFPPGFMQKTLQFNLSFLALLTLVFPTLASLDHLLVMVRWLHYEPSSDEGRLRTIKCTLMQSLFLDTAKIQATDACTYAQLPAHYKFLVRALRRFLSVVPRIASLYMCLLVKVALRLHHPDRIGRTNTCPGCRTALRQVPSLLQIRILVTKIHQS